MQGDDSDKEGGREQRFASFAFDDRLWVTFSGRRRDALRLAMFWVTVVLSGGLVFLVSKWSARFHCWTHTRKSAFATATHVMVVNSFGHHELLEVKSKVLKTPIDVFGGVSLGTLTTIDYKGSKFVLNPVIGEFVSLADVKPVPIDTLKDATSRIWPDDFSHRQHALFGHNKMHIHGMDIRDVFFEQVLKVFNVLQAACIIMWLYQQRWSQAVSMSAIMVSSSLAGFYEKWSHVLKMRQMSSKQCKVTLMTESGWCGDIGSDEIIPGDLIRLSDEDRVHVVPCDCILLKGDVLVDEAMLTGEVTPAFKTPIASEAEYAEICHQGIVRSRHSILYAGSKIIRAKSHDGRPPVMMAFRTGFLTSRGTLIQGIMFPRPQKQRFHRETLAFVTILAAVAFVGFGVASLEILSHQNPQYHHIAYRALDLFNIVEIYNILTVGSIFTLLRLKNRYNVACIDPAKMQTASRIDLMCFDKTGTFTEDGLDFKAAIAYNDGEYPGIEEVKATCHAIQEVDGALVGEPMDLRMFASSKNAFSNPTENSLRVILMNSKEVGIVRCIEFSAELKRMSCVIQPVKNPELISVVCKGSPDAIREVCTTESIPEVFDEVLSKYTKEGFRVIACAGRKLINFDDEKPVLTYADIAAMDRTAIERNLQFIGFIVFENRLKPSTATVIQKLHDVNIAPVMCTGDNILTAICVARSSGIISKDATVFTGHVVDESGTTPSSIIWESEEHGTLDVRVWTPKQSIEWTMACTGKVMQHAAKLNVMAYLLKKCRVYAAMNPTQKRILVEEYQDLNYTVGFCGDGANDCKALAAADVGISLGQTETSVAAPFTSHGDDISCVLDVIREGRASLVTTYGLLKFLALYSGMQFTSFLLQHLSSTGFENGQVMYLDIGLVLPLGILMSRFESKETLDRGHPSSRLFSFPTLLSILGHFSLQAIAQSTVYVYEKTNPNTAVFLTSTFLYITMAMLFSQGAPYIKRWYWPFFAYAILAIAFNITLVFAIDKVGWLKSYFQIDALSSSQQLTLVAVIGVHAMISSSAEFLVFPFISSIYNTKRLRRKQLSKELL